MSKPDANLEEQLQLAKEVLATGDRCENCTAQICGECTGTDLNTLRLAELVVALDEWLTNGGHKPTRWTH